MLNCKYKNLPKENKNLVKTNTSKAYIPTKIHRYKDMLMIRLSNKTIQIIYDTKDGFVYEGEYKNDKKNGQGKVVFPN